MRTLGCVGTAFAAGLILVGLLLVFSTRPDGVSRLEPIPITTPLPPPPTLDVRGQIGKIQPPTAAVAEPVIPGTIDRRPVPEGASKDRRRLLGVNMPPHDYFATAERLGGFALGERQVTPEPMALGDRRTFTTADGLRRAVLVHLTGVAAYWVEEGLALDRTAIAAAAEIVESRYLAPLQATFGREWSPGVDQDMRTTVLHTLGVPDDFELGYFSDENQYPRSLFVESNEREMVYLNMSRLEVGSELYLGTLLHEFQHLSQWNLDPNEQVWLNEGLSQLAETMAGLDTVDASAYLAQPTIRLDRWSSAPGEVYAHYAGSYLYLRYLWQRAGEAAVRELVRHPANGLSAVAAVLEGYLPGVTLDAFSADWAVATYLDSDGGSGPYGYDGLDLPAMGLATRARVLPFNTLGELDQMALDVIDLDLTGPVRLTFVGDTVTPLVDAPPPGGDGFWFAVPDNSSAPTLTAALDVPAVVDPALTFDLWHDLESGWDYAYLTASSDGGQTWEILPGRTTVMGQYGPAWNGRSAAQTAAQDGWLPEYVSLAAFTGQSILLRLEVLTDFEGPSRGVALANARVVAGGAESPLIWQPDGFTETGWLLPQEWVVRIIRRGQPPQVWPLTPDASGLAHLEVVLGDEGGAVIVMPLTPPSAAAAHYWLSAESTAASPGG
jgi:hypothetical protein